MGQSTKAVLQFLLLVLVFTSIAFWIDDENWPAKIGLPLAAVAVFSVICWANNREDKAPDILGQQVDAYFERLGFCFAIVPTVTEDRCVVQIFFQNRYANSCTARVLLRHCTFLPKRQQHKLSSIAVQIDCSGGECGVMQVPWGISQDYQGTAQILDVGADVTYPNRRGRLLRFREGLEVGDTNLRMFGFLGIRKPARCKLDLPIGVRESVPEESRYIVKTLWTPEN